MFVGVRCLLGSAVYFASKLGIFVISSPCCFACFNCCILADLCRSTAGVLQLKGSNPSVFAHIPLRVCCPSVLTEESACHNEWNTKREGGEPRGLQDPVPSQGDVFGWHHLKADRPRGWGPVLSGIP